ncbi:hypothetical protein MX01_101 [Escherichia phage MX01]|uniref:Uncharacterized protein n=1 Tax=Escherichia phage MX01 TaxID=1837930 RepID=A0A172Q206_9CAUD|nr:hypothetical protein BOW90_gp101 [Escherichia phage MX01]AND76046.1 hypothetical protein MX01_101 [Escherichia phage MX01]
MSLSKEQKDKLFELIHELLDANTECEFDNSLDWDWLGDEEDEFSKKENELIAYVNTL